MKKIINSKIFIFIIALTIGISGTLYAANIYYATDIIYNPSTGESMSVSEALNDLYENNSTCVIGTIEYLFTYTGSEQTVSVPVSGTYKLEVWGLQGKQILREEEADMVDILWAK